MTQSRSHIDHSSFLVHSWLFSLLFHSLAVGAAVTLLSNIRPPLPPEPFKWNIALVEPPPRPVEQAQQSSRSESSPSKVQSRQVSTPVEHPVAAPVPQATTLVAVELTRMEPLPTETQRNVKTLPAPQPTQPIIQRQEVVEPQPEVREVVPKQEPAPPVQAVTEPASQSAPTPQIEEHHQPPVQTVAVQPSHSPVHAPIHAPPAATAQPATAPAPAASSEPAPPASGPMTAKASSPSSSKTGKVDHRWLAQALWHRIEQIKQYPKLARSQGWEGRVIVRVLIKEDGSLLSAHVVESSGFEILDLDAVELIRQVCPIALKQALGQPHVALRIPIQYRLEQ